MYAYIKSQYWKHWNISLLLFILLGYVMTQVDCFIVKDLIRIEFAPGADNLYFMLGQDQSAGYCQLYNNTILDFGYMIAYTLLFYYSGRILCDLLEISNKKWLWLLCLPLLFDAVENLLLLQMLPVKPADYLSFCGFYWAVRLKWFFVVPGVIVSLIVLGYQLYVGLDRIYCWWKEER